VRQRVQEADRLDQVRRQSGEHQLALVQGLADQPELQLLQIAQATVEQLGRPAGRSRGQIPRFHQSYLETASGGIQRCTGTDHTATDDDDVELFTGQPLPVCRSLRRAQLPRSGPRGLRVLALRLPHRSHPLRRSPIAC